MKRLIEKRIDIARDRATGKLSTELAYMQLISAIDEFEERNTNPYQKAIDTLWEGIEHNQRKANTYYGGVNPND